MSTNDLQIGPRIDEIDYGDEITGIDYLTGIEFPLSRLVHVTADSPDFGIEEAAYIARFCYKYGCTEMMNPPVLVEEGSLEVIRKAMENDVPVQINARYD